MKLGTKICLGTAVVLFLFSQLFSLWNLQESSHIILEDVKDYEARNLEGKAKEYQRALTNQKELMSSSNAIVYQRSMFRKYFDMSCALYVEGKEIYNLTPYGFDWELAREQIKQRNMASQGNVWGVWQFTQSMGENQLLISVLPDVYENQECLIFQYKEIGGIWQKIRKLFLEGVALAFLLILILMVGLRAIVKQILRPFYQLQWAANEIAAGEYEKRVQVHSKDEIGQVSESFNQMAERVQAHVEELSRTNLCQRQLLGSLAHELKTPMMAIQGYAESLLRLTLSKEQQEKSLGYIESECKRLSRLSAKMLELTGLYQADGALEKEEISVKEFFTLVEAMAVQRMEKKKIHLRIQVEPENLVCLGDKDLLMSFLLNLIDNGCKASEEGSELLLQADEKGFYVQDCGCGIPADEVLRVTEAFYMVDKSRSRREGGAGLGLALCQQIAAAHGARLLIESQVGEGTTVSLLWEHA